MIVALTFSLLSSVLTSKFRTPSELHNDNFSLSTIAEGSHPNVRKLCDSPRTSFPPMPAPWLSVITYLSGDSSSPHLPLPTDTPRRLPLSLAYFGAWSLSSQLWRSA